MTTIKDLGIEKDYLKKKNVIFYKAFMVSDDAELKIDMDYDVYGITKEAAMQIILNSMGADELVSLEGKHVAFISLSIDRLDLSTSPVVEDGFGDVFYKNGILGLTIRKKAFKMHAEEDVIKEIEFEMNPSNEIKVLTHLVLETVETDLSQKKK